MSTDQAGDTRRMVALWTGFAAGIALAAALMARPGEGEAKGYVRVLEAYGTTRTLVVRGRALEARDPQIPAGRASRARNLVGSLRMLETDELEERPVTVHCLGRRRAAVTDDEGFFEVTFDFAGDQPEPGPASARVGVEGPDGARLRSAAKAFLYPVDVPRVIVSDFDAVLRRRPDPDGLWTGSLLPDLAQPGDARGIHGGAVLGRLPLPRDVAGQGLVSRPLRPAPRSTSAGSL